MQSAGCAEPVPSGTSALRGLVHFAGFPFFVVGPFSEADRSDATLARGLLITVSMTRRTSSRVLYFATILLSCVAAVVVACNDTAVTGSEDLAVGGGEDLSVGGSLEDLSSIPDGAVVIPGVPMVDALVLPCHLSGQDLSLWQLPGR
jgi:hypothetical protein